MTDDAKSDLLDLTTDIVSAYVGNNSVPASDLPALIKLVQASLANIDAPEQAKVEDPIKLTPGQIRKSIQPDGLVSFIDGKSYKTLKRHLGTNGMTIADYKAKFGLPNDYPTTAPSYSARRSEMAKTIGLGRKASEPVPTKGKRKTKTSEA